MSDSIEFMVMVKDAQGKFTGLGRHSFVVAPRTGEIVGFDDDKGIGQAYRVKAVMHPLQPTTTAGDLILEHLGTDLEFRQKL
jgi:hypothetical protein